MICIHESATLLLDLLCARIGPPLLAQFVPWLLEHGLNVALLVRELFGNRISAFFAMDVIVSAIVLIWFIQSEGKRSRVRLLWLPTVGTLLVGVSFGFPLFLFLRQVTLDRTTARGLTDPRRMTPNEFRELALSFPEAIESAHMRHPDFRVGGRIFATLGYPNENSAMVKLSPNEQKEFVRSSPAVFATAKGAWGRQGSTIVSLAVGNDRHRARSDSQQRGATPRRSGYRKIANASPQLCERGP